MLNLSTITASLYNMLMLNPQPGEYGTAEYNTTYEYYDQVVQYYYNNNGYTIERGARINFDPGRCPWIGVYPGRVDTRPNGACNKRWLDKAEIQIVIQTADFKNDGTTASDELERILEEVSALVNDDLTLGVSGVRVIGFSREYRYVVFDEDGSGGLFFPQAILKLELEARSS